MLENQLERVIDKMKTSNIKLTPQRVAVLEYLQNSKSHPTADDIYRGLGNDFPSISLATIYNNLHLLCENGLVRELTFGNSYSRYDGNTTNHYHIICDDCAMIVDFHYPLLEELEALAEQITNFEISHHELEIHGKCLDCRRSRCIF